MYGPPGTLPEASRGPRRSNIRVFRVQGSQGVVRGHVAGLSYLATEIYFVHFVLSILTDMGTMPFLVDQSINARIFANSDPRKRVAWSAMGFL